MKDRETGDVLGERIRRLEQRAEKLNIRQLEALASAVESEPRDEQAWPRRERYWFSGTAGVHLSKAEDKAVRRLWTRLMVATTRAVTGVDIEPAGHAATINSRLLVLLGRPTYVQIEGQAATLLERAFGGRIWRAFIGLWNAACAALLNERLDTELRDSLEASSRSAIGGSLRNGGT